MNPEKSIVAGALRAVSLAITVVSILTFATVAYSAYQDYSGVLDLSHTGTPAIESKSVVQGSSVTVFLNATIPNKGLLPLQASVGCAPGQPDVSCAPASMTVAPGEVGTLRFQITVTNFAQLMASPGGLHVNATWSFSLVSFAGFSASLDLGSLIHQGGA